ncbi:hypothetical protein NFI96_022799 [Prochilodus magdalenae]|nr:hypothetical protein NFI96_022799 [Prochilodus magdalenae]
MAARVQREALRLSSFVKILVIYLIISCIFARITRANHRYNRQTLLEIFHHCKNIVLDHPSNFDELPPELTRTPSLAEPFIPTGSTRRRRRDRKQRRGKRGGRRAKLRQNPFRLALPSIFLANVRSLVNKLDELKIWILTQRRLMDCSLMIFSETWLSSDVANSVVELKGRTVFRADRGLQPSQSQPQKRHLQEEHFNSSDPRRMWQGIRTITDYKPSSTAPHTNGASLSDELNHFYAHFDRGNKVIFSKMDLPPGEQPLTLCTTDVCHTLRRVSARKAAGPDEVPGRVLKACAEQLAGVFTDIFNLSLAQAVVPTIFKTATIVPVPKHSTASALNDFRPVALTPIISKCFERLVSSHVKSCLPAALDLHQFAYRRNRSTEDAISAALHTVLSHLDCQNSYVRMLFIDFSSAFNTVIPSKLISKLSQLGISTSLCNWILDFLTDRPQSVKLDKLFSSTITLNTGVPQGCVLSPLLYSLFTYDCVPVYGSNSIIKFADDTTVIGLIRGDDETAYRDEVQHLAAWCDDNNLVLNTQKTKEVIVDFRKSRNQAHTPIHISGAEGECVSNFKFLGVHISEDLTWSLNSSTMVKKAQQRLYFLRSLKKAHLCPRILVDFYRCTIESILTNCISVWYGSCSASDRKALQRVVKTAQRITGTQLPTTESVYQKPDPVPARSSPCPIQSLPDPVPARSSPCLNQSLPDPVPTQSSPSLIQSLPDPASARSSPYLIQSQPDPVPS